MGIHCKGGAIMKLILQVITIFLIVLASAIVTLRLKNQGADGPSVLFPGGELISGELHTGAEPDWAFTDDIFTIELQLNDPLSSRTIFVIESEGKVYVPSGYMRSFMGRLWKDWAFQADESDGLAVARMNEVRYERRLIRVTALDVIEAVAGKLAQKYMGGVTPEAVQQITQSVSDGDTWIFELAPRGDS